MRRRSGAEMLLVGERVSVYPFHFDQYDQLVKSLQGATTLYNTYWIRFAHSAATFGQTVEKTSVFIRAADSLLCLLRESRA